MVEESKGSEAASHSNRTCPDVSIIDLSSFGGFQKLIARVVVQFRTVAPNDVEFRMNLWQSTSEALELCARCTRLVGYRGSLSCIQ